MNKKEILEMSKKENAAGDEREKRIEQNANENAYIAIIGVYVLLGIVALIQNIATGEAFTNPRVLVLAIFVGFAGKSITRYFSSKEKLHLVAFIVHVMCVIWNLVNIFGA